ncbi:SRRT family protein [Megaselia abdita]
MAESDDEYSDKRRRDKFRGERSSGGGGGAAGGDNYRTERQDNRGGGRRDDWQDRNPFGRNRARPTYGDYRRDRFSPGRDLPPSKRMRGDWGDDMRGRYGDPYGGLYGGWGGHDYGMHGFGGGGGFGGMGGHGSNRGDNAASNNDVQTQPAMLTLKQFLDTQDDTISDSEVLKKYSEYKLDFRRQQLNEFFVTHKDEEWFKLKYHPEESVKRKDEVKEFLQRRVEVFTELLDKDLITAVSADTSQSEPLIKLLDTVVIKLEGGTEDDLKVLDQKPEPEVKIVEKKDDDDVIITSVKTKDDEKEENKEEKPSKKRKRSRSDSSDSSSGSDSSDSDEDVKKEKDKENKENVEEEKEVEKKEEEPKEVPAEDTVTEKPSESTETPEEEKKEEEEDEPKSPVPAADESKDDIESVATPKTDDLEVDEEEVEKTKEREIIYSEKVYNDPPPRALHRTSSIFLRNLSPSITKAEIEAVCKKFEGFLRVAIADPSVDRRWYRRGWVTFSRDVNIKEICWSLNNIRLRDCEMGAIVNRDLSRRVRPVNGITLHKTIIRNDIKTCAKIIMGLDAKFQLWDDKNTDSNTNGSAFGFNSKNPLLKNIADYLIEEASAEEEELLGLSGDTKEKDEGEVIERDDELVKVLDKLILYLRIVHSMDFYNHCEYPYEDEMPNRCGIIHARGPAPPNKITSNEIQDYIKNFENKVSTFITKADEIQEEELKNLGCKNADSEVDKFIQANTQELAKDKWLCPLSGKKFKGPEFIKKHILNKHGEKIDEVRKEVEYYNNYLKDPKRPQLPEHPGNNKRTTSESSNGPPGFRGGYPPMYPPYAAYPPMGVPMRGRGGFGGRGRRPRAGYTYRDWDAPTDEDDL